MKQVVHSESTFFINYSTPQPTRAFGDVALKWSSREKVLLEYVFDEPTFVPNYISPPYLSCTPDVHSAQLNPDTQFLIIATGGDCALTAVCVL